MGNPQRNTEKKTIKYITTTEPILKQKLNKNNIVTNQDHAKENTHQQNKWIVFTFFGRGTQQNAKIFKDTDTRITFSTINTVQKHLQPKQQRSNRYDSSCV
jgi:hypothetical protein